MPNDRLTIGIDTGPVTSTAVAGRLEFIVYGRPQQRGSKQAVLIPKRGGGWVEKNGRPIVAAKDDNPKSKDWMATVRHEAALAYQVAGLCWLVTVPCKVTLSFYFARPKSHYGNGKNATKLKPSAPALHAQSPDLDKLTRCLCDALTGVILADDKLIWRLVCERHWTDGQERAEVAIAWAATDHEATFHRGQA